ncbi:MAG TPA: PEP/pyruvate-binding domain-containing protein [Candidatus Dormibacteraeota bacterium]|nr:PEP/pyruvate-binding domain-containing protein [Candidatus Dormibacteraeota bacterium]
MNGLKPLVAELPIFDRKFWDGTFRCTQIGSGSIGGKASGLVFIKDLLAKQIDPISFPEVEINVPTMAVIATDCFDQFIAQNHLAELPFQEMPDNRIAHAFQKGDLPIELLGDLRALIVQVKTPLAIRSSSLLEDAQERPFAGVYATKMIPNNQPDPDIRFRRLVEAIKFVYASTYFREARDYMRTTGTRPSDEKMAVIIQEVVGQRRGDRFYPDISGVARSYNFYAFEPARPEDGVVTLALGLGKTIVDGGIGWTFSPAYPKKPPPFASVQELLKSTQTEFWAVNMGKAPAYDPVSESEYLVHANLSDAEGDEALYFLASTYDPERDRIVPGIGTRGPRILNFAPMLVQEQFPVNNLVTALLKVSERAMDAKVEIEFAITLQEQRDGRPRARLGFLQVRSMVVSDQVVDVAVEDLTDARAIVASDMVMGNGIAEDIQDIVFVRPDRFSPLNTPAIARELESINAELRDQKRPFLLIGFGRWGSSHPSLGIPVDWSQISGARAIVEATLPEMNVDLSQGSHFFHNLSSFRASYFMVQHGRRFGINWNWLNRQPVVHESGLLRHVRPSERLSVRVDGRTARGVVVSQTGDSTRQARK